MKLEDNLTYTANNRDGQTWLVCPGHPDILLTDHLPDGTKVRGDEITEPRWQLQLLDDWFYEPNDESHDESVEMGHPTRQVATLKHPDSYREREVVEDLTLEDERVCFGTIPSTGSPFILFVNDDHRRESLIIIGKDKLQALKSWINKIEL